MGRVTSRKRCHCVAPSISLASSTSSGMFCNAARNINMNVPDVVQMTRMMITHMAMDGPDSQSHQDRFRNSCLAQFGAAFTPKIRNTWWKTPRESASQFGPRIPTKSSNRLTAPPPWNRNRNTSVIAMLLVTDGK